MDFFSSTYAALRGPQGAPQTMQDTIDKLTDRLIQSTHLPDRRASVLALKGLSRDAKKEVGESALLPLLGVLDKDAEADADVGKAVLETLVVLCENDTGADGAKTRGRDDIGVRHSDVVLASPEPVHTLIRLLSQTAFYTRFTTLQLLSILLTNRPVVVQSYVLSSSQGVGALVAVLQERREIIRNEALLLLQNLISSNADLQKIVAFEGAFERLLDIATQEGGVEGGVVAQDCLLAIDALLRFNVSNQNYFRETSNIPRLPSLLLFPTPAPAASEPAPQAFALQFWDEQKLINAGLVVGLVQVLVGGVGSGKQASQVALLATGMTRCLIELSLASNAPISLKFNALTALSTLLSFSSPNQDLLSALKLVPYAWAGGDEWDKLPEQTAIGCLVRLALVGDIGAAVKRGGAEAEKEGLEARAAAVKCFESYIQGNVNAQEDFLASMIPAPVGTDSSPFSDPPQSAGTILLFTLITLPIPNLPASSINGLPPGLFNTYGPLFASHIFSHLLRSSESCRASARAIIPMPAQAQGEDEDEGPENLVQVLVGNLTLAIREQQRAREEGKVRECREWDRACVGWLMVLSTWLWESPRTVAEFLVEGANLQILIQPIIQAAGVDPLVQGLAAFLLGTCYEFNTEPGEITRATLHPILHSRIGADQFVNRMTRLREDDRFKSVTPDSIVVRTSSNAGTLDGPAVDDGQDAEVWFDWAFVEFWKNTYFSVQRAITSDPNAVKPPAGDSAQTFALIASLREVIKSQASDLEAMQQKLEHLTREREEERDALTAELDSLTKQVADLSSELSEAYATARKQEETRNGREHEMAEKISDLTEQVARLKAPSSQLDPEEHNRLREEIQGLAAKVNAVTAELSTARAKAKEQEKEQDDLLVLLDDLSQKRNRDKARMRNSGLEVSEGEEDSDEE